MSRRRHNAEYLKWFLDDAYPSRMPGSPDPEMPMDQNKPGSRVILKGKAWAALLDQEASRSYYWILMLIDQASAKSWAHRLAARYILLNTNQAGGHKELERIEDLGDDAASTVAKMCRQVLTYVLDRLDERGYWLGWGFDVGVKSRRQDAADRRRKGTLATKATALDAISAYYALMLDTDRSPGAAEVATMEHFDCGAWKVREATKEYRESLKEEKEQAS